MDPTVMAFWAEAGDLSHASLFSFPAATETTTPASCAAVTALFITVDRPPPRDMVMTDAAGLLANASATDHSTDAMTPEVLPLPVHDSACTGTMVACFATPYVAPATVEATCVPWTLQPLGRAMTASSIMPPTAHELEHPDSDPVLQPADQPLT